MRKQKPNKNKNSYVLRQDIYIPTWVRQGARAKALAASQAQMSYTEEIEIEEAQAKLLDRSSIK